VDAMYEDLLPLVGRADVLVASELIFAAPLLAATRGVRWVSFQLAPVSLFSLTDPPMLPVPDWAQWFQRRRLFARLVKRAAKIVTYPWWRPVRTLRRRLGLPPGANPLIEGKFSPRLNLVLFSSVLQLPQPDWPAGSRQTGFLFHEEASTETPLPGAVADFLAAGAAPIVFTLGSAAVFIPGGFYRESALAAQQLGRRALLLVGKNPPPPDLPPSILAWDYLPYAKIFPSAAAVVHQGGVGTTAQVLRAGKPMLVVPFAHDQFDNAARVTRLGVARTLSRSRYRASTVAAALDTLLNDRLAHDFAASVSAKIRSETALETAVTALEAALT